MNAKKTLWTIAATVAFIGLWLWLTPFFGPPGTQESDKTLAAMRYGDRGLCRPALIGFLFASLSDDSRVIDCQKVGAPRVESGLMALATAAVLAGATSRTFRSPADE